MPRDLIDLNFLQRQQERILDELRALRLEQRGDLQGVRDDLDLLKTQINALASQMGTLTAQMNVRLRRLENANQNQQDVNTLILDQLGKLLDRVG